MRRILLVYAEGSPLQDLCPGPTLVECVTTESDAVQRLSTLPAVQALVIDDLVAAGGWVDEMTSFATDVIPDIAVAYVQARRKPPA